MSWLRAHDKGNNGLEHCVGNDKISDLDGDPNKTTSGMSSVLVLNLIEVNNARHAHEFL